MTARGTAGPVGNLPFPLINMELGEGGICPWTLGDGRWYLEASLSGGRHLGKCTYQSAKVITVDSIAALAKHLLYDKRQTYRRLHHRDACEDPEDHI